MYIYVAYILNVGCLKFFLKILNGKPKSSRGYMQGSTAGSGLWGEGRQVGVGKEKG